MKSDMTELAGHVIEGLEPLSRHVTPLGDVQLTESAEADIEAFYDVAIEVKEAPGFLYVLLGTGGPETALLFVHDEGYLRYAAVLVSDWDTPTTAYDASRLTDDQFSVLWTAGRVLCEDCALRIKCPTESKGGDRE